MSLRDMLSEALALGHARSPLLIEGDPRDPARESGRPDAAAAVLVPVVDRPDPTVILTLRTDHVRRHAGQVAFPGGRIDPGDASPTAAALREAEEEIGMPPSAVDVIGAADRYRTITGFDVTPILGVVPPDLPLIAHPGEVAAIFEVPLHHLLDPTRQLVRTVDWEGRKRSYYEIEWEDRRIWGATAAMIVNLGRRLELAA